MKRLLSSTAAALAAPVLLVPSFAAAQEAEETRVDDVIVTAARLPAPVLETPGARRLDRQEIERRGAVFAAELLADVPGVSMARAGAFGGVAQVRIRGASPAKTLVLVDGVPVNDAAEVSGAFDFAAFDLGDVEAVEVLSGPQSSLWGSDAIGGVVAFTTREIDGLETDVQAGSFDTVRARLAMGRADERRALSASVSRHRTEGISAAAGGTEADGLTSSTAVLRGRSMHGGVTWDGAVRWSEAEAALDGFPPPAFVLADTDDRQHAEQASGFVRARGSAFGFEHAVSLSLHDLERETVSAFPSRFRADRAVLRWQADGRAGPAEVVFGAEREEATGSLSTGAEVSLGTTSAFAVGRLRPTSGLVVTGAVRLDDTDDFGSRLTGRLSAAQPLGGGLSLSGAWGTGFKTPSVSQAACDYCFSATPFPTLRPERAEGGEAALAWTSTDGRSWARATAYRLTVRDQITYVFDPATFEAVYVNLAETATDGVELEARLGLPAGFDLTVGYAWTDARDETTGDRLLRVPERSGSVILGWADGRMSGALAVRGESEQADAGGVRDGFVTADLKASWRLTDQVELTARIDNLGDAEFQQVLGYGEPGRSAYLGVRLRY